MQVDGLMLQLLKPLDSFSDVVIGDRRTIIMPTAISRALPAPAAALAATIIERMPRCSSSSSNMPAMMAPVAPIG